MIQPTPRFLRAAFDDPVRQFQLSLLVLALLVGLGTLGYVVLEDMSWVDALYMTVITLTTVGFAEVRPLSEAGRVFTIGLIVLGVGTAAWALRNAAEIALGDSLWLSVQRHRMDDRIASLESHYIVCGYGRMGRQIARDLRLRGELFVVVEMLDDMVDELLEEDILHVQGDATHEEVLLQAGVRRAAGFVAALDTDADTVMAVLTARGLNPDLLIVARASSEASIGKLRRAGADRVVSPYVTGGHRLALSLVRPAVNDFLNYIFGDSVEVDVGQIAVFEDSPLAGQTLAECDLRREWNLTVLAVQHPDGSFNLTPSPDHVIRPGETLIVIGPGEAIYRLEKTHRVRGTR